jgi:Protein of unknown function (DUF3313)
MPALKVLACGLAGRGRAARAAGAGAIGPTHTEDTMQRSTPLRRVVTIGGLVAALMLAGPLAVRAAEPAPQETKEGLKLKTQTKQRLVYMRPGADVKKYNSVAILDCYIEFSKDWLRNYNSSQRDPGRQISNSDLERAKTDLSAQFKKIFTEELQSKGAYKVVEGGGPDVLVLRPALINIAVSAPDLMAPGRSVTYAQSAGQMTLYLELWDSASNTILARAMDARGDSDVYGSRSSSVSNRAAADRMLKSWAQELHTKLDIARTAQ